MSSFYIAPTAHGGQFNYCMSPVGSCAWWAVVTVGSCRRWAVVHGGQLSPVGSCPVGQLSGGQMSGGQLSGGEMSAHRYYDSLHT